MRPTKVTDSVTGRFSAVITLTVGVAGCWACAAASPDSPRAKLTAMARTVCMTRPLLTFHDGNQRTQYGKNQTGALSFRATSGPNSVKCRHRLAFHQANLRSEILGEILSAADTASRTQIVPLANR